MNDSAWPAPLPGAPYTERSLLTLRFAREAAEASDAAAAVVTHGALSTPRDLIREARLEDVLRAVARAQDMLDTAVLVARADGAEWGDIAEIATAYGQHLDAAGAEARWGPYERDWEQQLVAARQPDPGGLPEELADPEACAQHLDTWLVAARSRLDGRLARAETVSGQLHRMDVFAELAHISQLRDDLRAASLAPPPELLAPLYDREAELCQAMADAGHDAYTASAQHCRERAAHLREQVASTTVIDLVTYRARHTEPSTSPMEHS